MPNTITDTTAIAAPVNVVFQQTLLRNAKARAPYFLGSAPANIQHHSGSFKAKWRRINNLTPTTTALSELATLVAPARTTSVEPTVSNITATVSKYGQYLVLNEEADLVNFNGQTDKLVEVMGISAGRSLNMLQRNEMEDNATAVFANGSAATAVNTIMSRGDIRNVVNTLNRNSAMKFTPETNGSSNFNTSPIRDSYWGLCHSDVEEDIRQMTGFVGCESYGSQTKTETGEFGYVGGVRWISSEDAGIITDTGATGGTGVRETTNSKADLYDSIIFGMEAVGSVGFGMEHLKEVYKAGDNLPGVMMIHKDFGSGGTSDPMNEVSTMSWKSWHAAQILNSDWIRRITSAASSL